MADLIERLRTRGTTYSSGSTDGAGRGTSVTHFVPDRLCAEAAARIAELEAEVARLREALVWCADAPMTTTGAPDDH